MAPDTVNGGENRVEGGDELDAYLRIGSSAYLKLEKNTALTAGMASRRGTRLSSMGIVSRVRTPWGQGLAGSGRSRPAERGGRARRWSLLLK